MPGGAGPGDGSPVNLSGVTVTVSPVTAEPPLHGGQRPQTQHPQPLQWPRRLFCHPPPRTGPGVSLRLTSRDFRERADSGPCGGGCTARGLEEDPG